MLKDGDWNWLLARSEELVLIQSCLCLVKIGVQDAPLWFPSKNLKFSSRETWEAIRVKMPKVDWVKLVWFSYAILGHSFFLWLAIKDNLSTGDRILRWGG